MINITVDNLGAPGQKGTDGLSFVPDPSTQITLIDDFVSNSSVGNIGFTSLTTSGGSTSIIASESNHIGICRLSTGTASSSSNANLHLGTNSVYFGNGEMNFETLIRIPTLSSGSERYTIRIGFGDSNSSDASLGIWFEYLDSVSANWQICVNDANTASKTITSKAVSENTWIKLKINLNLAGNILEFFVDGVSVGTISSQIPTASGVRFHVVKSVGTGARTLDIDFMKLTCSLIVSR